MKLKQKGQSHTVILLNTILLTWSEFTAVAFEDSFLTEAGFISSLGTISMRKSNWSYLVMAIAISFLYKEKFNPSLFSKY